MHEYDHCILYSYILYDFYLMSIFLTCREKLESTHSYHLYNSFSHSGCRSDSILWICSQKEKAETKVKHVNDLVNNHITRDVK